MTDQRLPLSPVEELWRMVAHAEKNGAGTAKAKLLAAIAYIESLEAENESLKAKARAGVNARVSAQSPTRRAEIASIAARRRWNKSTPSTMFDDAVR